MEIASAMASISVPGWSRMAGPLLPDGSVFTPARNVLPNGPSAVSGAVSLYPPGPGDVVCGLAPPPSTAKRGPVRSRAMFPNRAEKFITSRETGIIAAYRSIPATKNAGSALSSRRGKPVGTLLDDNPTRAVGDLRSTQDQYRA